IRDFHVTGVQTCALPICHETYPTNDFDPSVAGAPLQGKPGENPYVDNGWGWTAADGEKYWFVAYANQWFFNTYIKNAIRNLGREIGRASCREREYVGVGV